MAGSGRAIWPSTSALYRPSTSRKYGQRRARVASIAPARRLGDPRLHLSRSRATKPHTTLGASARDFVSLRTLQNLQI